MTPSVRGVQDTPASSLWSQLCSPQELFGHCSIESSFPVQRTSSNIIGPEPSPKYAWFHALAMPLNKHKNSQAQLPADHFCICFIPLVITDSPPLTSMVELHSAFPGAAPTHEAYDGKRWAMGKATCDSSCHLLRTHPTLPDVFFTKQYIFFISSATDIAPINGNKAQSRKRGLFCYSFSSLLQLVTND